MADEVREFFEKTSNYLHKDYGVRYRQELVIKYLGPLFDKRIIDFGCGNGAISMPFVESNKVTFVDFSSNMLKLVEQSIPDNSKNNCKILQRDIFDVPKDPEYDIIILIGVLAHVKKSLPETLAFFKGFLSKNGRLIVQFSDGTKWITKISLLVRRGKYRVNKLSSSIFENNLIENHLQVAFKHNYATAIPGMGIFSNRFLLRYVRFISSLKVFGFLKSEYLYVIETKI